MPISKQTKRRRMAQLKSELYNSPWAIDVRALSSLSSAIELGDIESIRASLSFGADNESITKIVNGVAVIPVNGVLCDEVNFMVRWGYASSYQLIERDFNQAIDNSQVKGVLFYMNSPGGSAIGCKRLADLIFSSRGAKPIRAFVQGMCGSAAFYVASACDRIEATADSLVGSVGTIMPHQEFSGYLKELGVGAKVFTNTDSPKKGHGNIYEPLTDAAKATLQQFVDSYGRPFINDVARYRGIKPEDVIAKYGQGEAMRADVAIKSGVIDAVVESFSESLESLSGTGGNDPNMSSKTTPVVSGNNTRRSTMNERIKAQLFALGLIDSLDASDEICKAALAAWFRASGKDVPKDEAKVLADLQRGVKSEAKSEDDDDAHCEDDEEEDEDKGGSNKGGKKDIKAAHDAEQKEARLVDLRAAASLHNDVAGSTVITAEMVLEAHDKGLNAKEAGKHWAKTLNDKEGPMDTGRVRVTGEGYARYATDIVDALAYRAGGKIKLSEGAESHINKPLWAVAAECLQMSGIRIDMYADREFIAEQAMQMGTPNMRHTFYSERENRRYIQASGAPAARPGDFPNILSSLSRKYLDTIQLEDDYSYPKVSAVLPGGLNDFKPGLMINKGIVEELDEVQDAEAFKELGLSEEVLSYIFLRRFGNKWGWTPVMVANDDMNAFAEGMLGLEEAWQVTQNRLVVDLFTSNPTLLDGAALFANRTDVNGAANNNIAATGGVPSDATWGACEVSYADISGIGTGRRVRGALNTWFGPTGAQHIEARRTFMPLNAGGLENKQADTTANVGIYRGLIDLIPESELRASSALIWYALRSPTRLNTATIVRGYFNGFGEQGKRERWYDPETKTTWVSIEGRIATAVKNFRYAVRNPGA